MQLMLSEGRPTRLSMDAGGKPALTVPSWDEAGLRSLLTSREFQRMSREEQDATVEDWVKHQDLHELMNP